MTQNESNRKKNISTYLLRDTELELSAIDSNSRLIGSVSQSQLKPNSKCSMCSSMDTNAGAAVAVAKVNIDVCDSGMRAVHTAANEAARMR